MQKRNLRWYWAFALVVLALVTIMIGCQGPPGERGPAGPAGPQGPPGEAAAVPTFALRLDPNQPGCGGACHEQVLPYIQPNPEGKYTLAYEANHAYPGHGFDPLGKLLTLNDCLKCHAVGTGERAGKGNVASVAMRDIVHKVHLSSPHFTAKQLEGEEAAERQGDCFTCHVVSGPSTTGLYK